MTVTLPCEETKQALNEDPEFALAARLWSAGVRLDVGGRKHLLTVRDGVVEQFTDDPDPFDPYTITIGGPEEGWGHLLQAMPPPFYQDFWGAFFRHDFEMGGDLELLYVGYGAVRRMLEVMRETYNRTTVGG
jgi:hypothetical protein